MEDTEPRNTDPKPEPRPDPKPEPRPDPEPEPKPEPKPDPGPEPRPASESDPKTAPKTAPKTDPKTDPNTGPRTAPDPAPEAADGDQPPPRPKRRRLRRTRRLVLAAFLVLLLPLLTAETALRVNYMGDPADGTRTRNRDAMWLGHAWVDGRKDDADLAAFAARLKTTGIRDLYVHTGPLEHDGTLPKARYPKARWFIDAVHRELPGVRVQAFLGDVLVTEAAEGMRLNQAGTRAAVVDSARQVLDAGYDGVHLDLEPVHSDDRDYLSLLDDLRAVTRAEEARLSVAAHQIDPLPALHTVFNVFTENPKWWSQEFFGQVARRVDQIAVMTYDTAQPLEGTYGGYVAQQTSLALEVTPPTTHLLMGLPFYHESNFDHWGHAETVEAAVRGARLGLSRTDADRRLFGVAPYIDFAATETNWKEYQEGWVGRGTP
ncbi:glycosyl hydrolase family 18 protein [Streptomyces sp. WAC08452]|uniref:glycosyl hydrolase family 18 protein n=1 Tax=Streptomyces sp. WAC08452 TaxID=2487414 RepID=UPI0021AEE5DA|nr:glycosyl hydrolase family 18 protein [Streptomyces sp. WAC08452]